MNTPLSRLEPARFLKKVEFAAGLPDDVLADLARVATEKTLLPGDRVFREGDRSDGFYLLLSGRVNFTIAAPSGRHKLVGWVEKGQAVGLSAMVADKPHAVTAVAALKTSALFLPQAAMLKLLARYPELWLRLSVLLSVGVQQAYSHRAALHRPAHSGD